jgi:hypothetical protein
MRPSGRLKQVTLPSGGKVTVPDDGKPFEVMTVPGGEGIRYGDGSTVTFRRVSSTPKPAPAAKAATDAPSMKVMAAALGKFLSPIIRKQNDKISELEARIQELERTR